MEDTWASRDLPVLNAVVGQLDELPGNGGYPDAADIASSTGLDVLDVAAALNALDGDYVTLVRPLTASDWHVTKVTPAARRAVGQWPTGESLIMQLASGISQAADQEPDPERKRRLLMVGRELGGAAKAIAINVASQILEHHMPR